MGVTYVSLCVRESHVCVLAYSKVHFKLVFIPFLIEEELVLTRRFTSEKAMATHSSALTWRIPWTGEPGRLLFMGSHRVGHN